MGYMRRRGTYKTKRGTTKNFPKRNLPKGRGRWALTDSALGGDLEIYKRRRGKGRSGSKFLNFQDGVVTYYDRRGKEMFTKKMRHS